MLDTCDRSSSLLFKHKAKPINALGFTIPRKRLTHPPLHRAGRLATATAASLPAYKNRPRVGTQHSDTRLLQVCMVLCLVTAQLYGDRSPQGHANDRGGGRTARVSAPASAPQPMGLVHVLRQSRWTRLAAGGAARGRCPRSPGGNLRSTTSGPLLTEPTFVLSQ